MADYLKKNKIDKVSFDRSGYKYHGKVKALADSERKRSKNIMAVEEKKSDYIEKLVAVNRTAKVVKVEDNLDLPH